MKVIPSDLVREILLRVPYKWHDNLKAVCRKWDCMVGNPKFYEDRKIRGASEHLLCLIQHVRVDEDDDFGENEDEDEDKDDDFGENDFQIVRLYDPVNGTSHCLPPIDDPDIAGVPRLCQCVVVKQKLVLMGAWYRSKTNLMKRVYIYDFVSARWSRGADMPIPQAVSACSVCPSTGLVYVAGGFNEDHEFVDTAEAYNVEEDKWEMLPPMIERPGEACKGVFLDGKFIMITEDGFDPSAEVFDPSARTWTTWENMLSFRGQDSRCSATPCSSSSGELYVFCDPQVMKYDSKKKIWNVVSSVPQTIGIAHSVTLWGDCFFVSGTDFHVDPLRHASYLFNTSTLQWIEVDGGGEEDFGVNAAATVEV